jgi:hypothetical protein
MSTRHPCPHHATSRASLGDILAAAMLFGCIWLVGIASLWEQAP